MPTCRDVVTRAMRQLGVLAIGRAPKATEADYALGALQSMYDEWVSGGMFGRLTDKFKTGDYTAAEGERVTIDGTLTIPETVEDEVLGDYRAPREFACIVEINNGVVTNRVYSLGEWQTLTGLTLDSDAPLVGVGLDGLSACLAERIATPFGVQPDVFTLRAAGQFKRAVSYKVGSTQPVPTQTYY